MKYRFAILILAVVLILPLSVYAAQSQDASSEETTLYEYYKPGSWLPTEPRPTDDPTKEYYLPQNLDSRYLGEEEYAKMEQFEIEGVANTVLRVYLGWGLNAAIDPRFTDPVVCIEAASSVPIPPSYLFLYEDSYWEATGQEGTGTHVELYYATTTGANGKYVDCPGAYQYLNELLGALYPYVLDPSLVFTDISVIEKIYFLYDTTQKLSFVYYDTVQTDWVLFNSASDPSQIALMNLEDFQRFASENCTNSGKYSYNDEVLLYGGDVSYEVPISALSKHLFTTPVNPVLPDYTWVWFVCGGAAVLAVGAVGTVLIVRRRKSGKAE